MFRFAYGLVVVLMPVSWCGAQHIVNVTSQAVGNKIVIHYDIDSYRDDQQFEVALYTSRDQFSKALHHVSGNGIGGAVSGGKSRVIIWDVLQDVPQLNEQLSFEVRAIIKPRVQSEAVVTRGERVTGKDDAYAAISASLTDYINEARDFKDAFEAFGLQATGSRQALGKLTDATDQYNRAFEKLNKERLTYEKYVSGFWKDDVQAYEFKAVMDYALGDLHSVNILTLNQKIGVINDIANGKVKRPGEQKKVLEKDIREEVLELNMRLQELERRANRIMYKLSQD